MTRAEFYRFMKRCRLGVLGTVGESGLPQSALIGIAVSDQLEVVFDTVKSSRKYRNLVANPACSLAVGWSGADTVQYEGVAEELQASALDAYQQLYFSVWPDGPSRLAWPGIVYFVVRPSWIRYSDFGQAPPLIREFSFGQTRGSIASY